MRLLCQCGAGMVACSVLVMAVGLWQWKHHAELLSYWEERGVYTAPNPLPFIGHGTEMSAFKWAYTDEVYHMYRCEQFCGLYALHTQPMLLVKDPELVEAVLVKDFHHFDRRDYAPVSSDVDPIFSRVLTEMKGDEWKANRAMLSPAFTKDKLKTIYSLLKADADKLVTYIETKKKTPNVSVKEIFTYFKMMVVSSTILGLKEGTFNSYDFSLDLQFLSLPTVNSSIRKLMYFISPRLCRFLGLRYSSTEFWGIEEMAQEAMRQRRESNRKRGHFLDLLMTLVEQGSETSGFILQEDTAVAAAVAFAQEMSYDRVTATLGFVAHHLANSTRYQDSVRRELRQIVKQHNGLPYEALMRAKRLDAVVLETLRMYPPAVEIQLLCTKNYRLPGTAVTLEKGTIVLIPTFSLHSDPQYWKHSEYFYPVHFLSENRRKIVRGTYLPFGLGPRSCIGKHFALMEIKVAVAKMLLNYKLAPPLGREDQEIQDPVTMRPHVDMELRFTRLTGGGS